ncbi:hypothetical protein HKX48_009411, partial [Thoreauomyces humboldtii]
MARSKAHLKRQGKKPSTSTSTTSSSSKAPAKASSKDDLDINAFIEEQQLEIDPEVRDLLVTDKDKVAKKKVQRKKGKKAQAAAAAAAAAADSDDEHGAGGVADDDGAEPVVIEGTDEGTTVDMNEEDALELAAYLEMMKGKDDKESDDDLVEKVFANNT